MFRYLYFVCLTLIYERVTAQDNPLSVEFCPESMVLDLPEDANTLAVTWNVPIVNHTLGETVMVSSNHMPGDSFPAGEVTVEYQYVDQIQPKFKINCTFDITVQDVTDPVLGCLERYDVTALSNYGTFDWQTAIEATDNSGQVAVSSSHDVLFRYPLDDTLVNLTAVDPSGNEASCQFVVSVSLINNPLSVEFCPESMVLDLPEDANTLAVTWNVPIVNHTLGETVIVSSNHMPGDSFPAGEVTVEYQYVDQIQPKFKINCTFDITVQDVTDPVLGCLERYDVTALSNYGTFDWQTAIEATDNSGQVAVSSSHDVLFRYPLDDTLVNLTAVDPSGNEASCQFVVSVSLINNPLSVEFCPESMVLDLPEDANTLAVTWNVPIVNHTLGRTVIVSSNHMPGDSFPAGEVTVEYQYVDQIQPKFKINCTFDITVQDVTGPVLGCLERYDVTALSNYGTFDWQTAIEATDNSGQVAVSSSHDVLFRYPLDDTPVNLTAVDPSGNEASCQFVVSVSLIIALPFLIAIAAVILLVILVICCCLCSCCCRPCRGEETGGQEDSVGMDQLSKGTEKASKSFGDSEPSQVQNTNFTSGGENPQMATGPTAPPLHAGVTNQGMENDEYMYVIGDENPATNPLYIPETQAVDGARSLPYTPHPSSQSSPIQAAAITNYENHSLMWSSLPTPVDRFDAINKPPVASPRENTDHTIIY